MDKHPPKPFMPTVSSQPSYEVSVITPILQMRTPRLTEGTRLAQSSAVRKQFSATLGIKHSPCYVFLKRGCFPSGV